MKFNNGNSDYLQHQSDGAYLKIQEDFSKSNMSLLDPLRHTHENFISPESGLLNLGEVSNSLKVFEPLKTNLMDMSKIYGSSIDPIASNALDTSCILSDVISDAGTNLLVNHDLSKGEEGLIKLNPTESDIFSALPNALTTSILSQDISAKIDQYTEPLHLNEQMSNFKNSAIDLSAACNSIYEDLSEDISGLYSSSPLELTLPVTELYTTVKLPELVVDITRGEVEEEAIKKEIVEKSTRLESLLTEIDNDLLVPYRGMIEAISVEGTDKTRYFCSSGRELFTHVLHKLSPDDMVFQWDTERRFLHNGIPTRAGRINYICRNIRKSETFSRFMEKDIETKLAFLDVMQEGVHELNPAFDNTQLIAIKTVMESTIVSLIEFSRIKT